MPYRDVACHTLYFVQEDADMPSMSRWIASLAAFAAVCVAHQPQYAYARPRYLMVFKDMYPETDGVARCALCHVGKPKTTRTEYGIAVEEALASRNVRDVEVIKAALKKAEDKLPK